jgi:hypothetical protein
MFLTPSHPLPLCLQPKRCIGVGVGFSSGSLPRAPSPSHPLLSLHFQTWAAKPYFLRVKRRYSLSLLVLILPGSLVRIHALQESLDVARSRDHARPPWTWVNDPCSCSHKASQGIINISGLYICARLNFSTIALSLRLIIGQSQRC